MTTTPLETADLTGIGVIDDQHQQIFALIDTLGEMARGDEREQTGEAINRIVSHTLAHFEFEEELMEQVAYPFLKVHKRLHDHFIQRLAGYTQRFDAGEDIAVELEQFLSSWLRSHFAHEDKDYSPQVLAEMQGLTNETAIADNEGWFSRTLRLIA